MGPSMAQADARSEAADNVIVKNVTGATAQSRRRDGDLASPKTLDDFPSSKKATYFSTYNTSNIKSVNKPKNSLSNLTYYRSI